MMQAGTGRIELMLLVDGELQGLDAALVGRRCRDDPTIGAAVSALEIERTFLRAAFPVEPGVEHAMLTALDTKLAVNRARQRRAAFWRILGPLAASIAAAILIGSITLDLAQYRARGAASQVLAEQARDRQLMAVALNTALDTQISGGSVTWQNPASGSRGSITPLRTFRTSNGRWCREYRQELDSAAQSEQRIGIACREADGWQLKLERPWAA